MKRFNRLCISVMLLIVAVFVGANVYLSHAEKSDEGRPYRVEINRLVRKMEGLLEQEEQEKMTVALSVSEYEYITAVVPEKDTDEPFYESNSDYVIREIAGERYRIEYTAGGEAAAGYVRIVVNVVLVLMTVLILFFMLYIRQRVLRPFQKMERVPYELSKGNLTAPLSEQKNRFFGRFVWGVNLLRENMEQQKSRELELQKEKKTLLLSLSHDIKTPLSAIKLYSKALSKGLYDGKEKQTEIAENINAKADEIEGFVSEIIRASSEDFLSFELRMGEFYLSELVKEIEPYYAEKLSLIKTEFSVGEFADGIIKGDKDRAVEVLQNLMENAIKYGNGECIGIEFSEEDGCRLISVVNGGCTLPEAELSHIFDSFWRGSNAEGQPGSGLGLYICRKLMRTMGGEVFAEKVGDTIRVTAVFPEA